MSTARKQIECSYCKTFGHWWDEFVATNLPQVEDGCDRINHFCPNCTTERYAIVDMATGDLVKPYEYAYPDDYKILGVKFTKSELRLAYLAETRRLRRVA